MTLTVANWSGGLATAPLWTSPPLPARDPRFVHGPIELCQLLDVWQPDTRGNWQAEEKFDGVRVLYFDEKLWTREGDHLLCLPEMEAELYRLQRRFGRRMFFDAEWVEPDGFHDTLSVMGSRGRKEARGVLHVFDALRLDQWRADDCPTPLHERQRLLRLAMGDWRPERLRLVDPGPVVNGREVEAMAAGIWERGGEGLVLKDRDSLYRRRRSSDWKKLKLALSLSVEICEVLGDGAAVKVLVHGKACKVAVPPHLRGTLAVGMCVRVKAMEFTARGLLRQGIVEGIAS